MLKTALATLPMIAGEAYDKMPAAARARLSKDQFLQMLRTQILSSEFGISVAIKKLMPEIANRFNATTEQRMGILCLTEEPDDLLMWAHYGCSHEGFVIELDPKASFFNQRRSEVDEFRHLRPVIYSSSRPTLTFSQAKDLSALLTKSDHWAYEKEWRMMLDLNDASAVISVGGKRFHLFEFQPETIKSVIFGARMAERKKMEILDLISTRPLLKHINCFQAVADEMTFKLNLYPLTDQQ